ncbi:hypothetical protein [Phenylobacterium sp.]|jgi:uncharacterized membrane protein YkoI|uniref:PepSY domain-containing protein n=1 Tax=Phenylobacterium sp. TaxID=1871053 RepID=UPI002F408BF7
MTRQHPFAALALGLVLGVAPLAGLALPAHADGAHQPRRAPLPRVLKMLAERYKGRQLNTTMGEAGGRAVYLVQWQLPDGRIKVFTVDAQTGQVVGS